MPIPETDEHKSLKDLFVVKLKEWYGASISEYHSAGHRLDVVAATSDGISIYVEIVWNASEIHFFKDINSIQQSDDDVKIMIGSPEVINNEKFVREFSKLAISQAKLGKVIHSEILDGCKILHDAKYVNTVLRQIFEKLVKRARAKKSAGRKESTVERVNREGIDVEPETIFTRIVLRVGRRYLTWRHHRLYVPLTKEIVILIGIASALFVPLPMHLFSIINNHAAMVDVYQTFLRVLLIIPTGVLLGVVTIILKRKCTKCNGNLAISKISSKLMSERKLYTTDTAIHMRRVYHNTYKCELCGDACTKSEREIYKIPLHDGL